MEIMLSCVSVFLMWVCGKLNCSWSRLSEVMWVVPLAPAIIMAIGGTFHPLRRISLRRGIYFAIFC